MRLLIIFTIWMLVLGSDVWAAGSLRKITVAQHLSSSRVTLDIFPAPRFRLEMSGQRVDLFLSDTQPSSSLLQLPEDDRIIRTVLARRGMELVVSFLLREVPRKVLATPRSEGSGLDVDLLWNENETRPAIAFAIEGVPVAHRTGAASTTGLKSEFSGRWIEFFREYRSSVSDPPALRFSVPPLPDISGEEKEAAGGAGENMPAGPEGILKSVELLMRQGEFARALEQVRKLTRSDLLPEENARRLYLKALALDLVGRPFEVGYLLEKMKHVTSSPTLKPYFRLLAAETALAVGRPGEALSILETPVDDKSIPPHLSPLLALRRADALAAAGKDELALEAYLPLTKNQMLWHDRPLSLATAAGVFSESRRYSDAADFYRRLAECLEGREEKALANFASALASLDAGEGTFALQKLAKISEIHWNAEAGFRAQMMLLDQRVLESSQDLLPLTINEYGSLAERISQRDLRSEAELKMGIGLFLCGETEKSVQVLSDFRRNFRSGALYGHAGVLLVEQLPGLIGEKMAKGEDFEALLLLEQNRRLLLEADLPQEFLQETARAYERLGLWKRAARLHLFLLSSARGSEYEKKHYPPLTALYMHAGDFASAEKFARRYLERFPKADDRDSLLRMLILALRAQGKYESAVAEIGRHAKVLRGKLALTAAEIFFSNSEFARVADSLAAFDGRPEEVPENIRILWAEALYQEKKYTKAQPLFRSLEKHPAYAGQAQFRQAQMYLARKQKKDALNYLSRLSEKEKDSHWSRMARETLELVGI